MHRIKPIIAKTPEDLAVALGLSAVAAKEWQVHHILQKRLKEIVRRHKITHAEIARRAAPREPGYRWSDLTAPPKYSVRRRCTPPDLRASIGGRHDDRPTPTSRS